MLFIYYLNITILIIASQRKELNKLCVILGCVGIFVYFFWRINYTIVPFLSDDYKSNIFMWGYVGVEFLSIFDMFQHWAYEILKNKRNKIYSPLLHSVNQIEAVDLVIPTYNESIVILRSTLLCALEIEWDNLTINILDDGNRSEVRELALELNVRYFCRDSNEGAKAGNMNAALPHLDGDFIAILDADFCAYRSFIKRAMIAMRDARVGCVQFPQTFYNADVTQNNTKVFSGLNNEQWLWYHVVLPSRDIIDLATSCGSCSVVRRKSLDLIGGKFPEATITEDYDLSLRLISFGQITRYIDEPVAIGLNAQSVDGFIIQRKRWALGNLKAFYLSFKRQDKIPIWKKVLLFEWRVVSHPARYLTLTAPISVFLFDIWPLKVTSLTEYLAFTAPFMFIIYQYELKNTISIKSFFLSQARATGLAIILSVELIRGLLSWKPTRFEVTPKSGNLIPKVNKKRSHIMPTLVISSVSMCVGGYKFLFGMNEISTDVTLVWQAWNIILIVSAFNMFNDRQAQRATDRFVPKLKTAASIYSIDNKQILNGDILDVSKGGLSLETKTSITNGVSFIRLAGVIFKVNLISEAPTKNGKWKIRLKFNYLRQKEQDALIKFIYTGDFMPEITNSVTKKRWTSPPRPIQLGALDRLRRSIYCSRIFNARALAKPGLVVQTGENVGIEAEPMTKKNLMIETERLEAAFALEITQLQRDSLKAQVEQLSVQLHSATQRAERSDERLHETSIMISNLSMQAIASVKLSSVSEVVIEDRNVLRLSSVLEVVIEGQSVLRLLNPLGNSP